MTKGISIAKIGENTVNEDSILFRDKCIAVSDGAGGGGLFAERWSKYLLDNIPSTPIQSADDLDNWIGDIWEPFFNTCECEAKCQGGMFLDKFYDEGSYATLAALWIVDTTSAIWCGYGDSALFCYHHKSKELECSIENIKDFNRAPALINSKDELDKTQFKCGHFFFEKGDFLFACSDALAHYILMMYNLSNKNLFQKEIESAIQAKSRNSNYIQTAFSLKFSFENDVLKPLLSGVKNESNMVRHLKKIIKNKLIAIDDYSIVIYFP